MVIKADQDRVRTLLRDTITLLCRNGLSFDNKFCIDAVIGVTVDDDDVFLVSMNELVKSEKAIQNESRAERSDEESLPNSPGSRGKGRNHKRKKRKRRFKTEGDSDGSDGYDNESEGSVSANDEELASHSQNNESSTGQANRTVNSSSLKQEAVDEDDDDEDLVFIKEEPHDPALWQHQQGQDPSMISNMMETSNSALGEGDQNFSSLSEMNLVPVGPGDENAMWSQAPMMSPMQQRSYRPRGPRTSTVTSGGVDGQPVPGQPSQDSSQMSTELGVNTCEFCGKTFTWKSNYRRHVNTHFGKYTYHCDMCGMGCSSREKIDNHMKRVHQRQQQLPCKVCKQTFLGWQKLQEHMVIHRADIV